MTLRDDRTVNIVRGSGGLDFNASHLQSKRNVLKCFLPSITSINLAKFCSIGTANSRLTPWGFGILFPALPSPLGPTRVMHTKATISSFSTSVALMIWAVELWNLLSVCVGKIAIVPQGCCPGRRIGRRWLGPGLRLCWSGRAWGGRPRLPARGLLIFSTFQ